MGQLIRIAESMLYLDAPPGRCLFTIPAYIVFVFRILRYGSFIRCVGETTHFTSRAYVRTVNLLYT